MTQRSRNLIMWGLYALLFLAVLLVQTVLFGRLRFFGVKLNLMPVVIVCIGLWTGHEAGGLFGLLAAVVWFLTGADDGSLSIVSFTLAGILSGWFCDNLFRRRLFPCLVLSLAALLAHEGVLFLLKFFLEGAEASLALWVPVTAGLSLLPVPVIYLLSKAIGKAGGN